MAKNLIYQNININFLIENLYNYDHFILPYATSAPKKNLNFLEMIFPEEMRNCSDESLNLSNVWESTTRVSKLINRSSNEPGPMFVNKTVYLLNRNNEIILDINRNWAEFWAKFGGDFSLFRQRFIQKGINDESFIDKKIIGEDLSKIILGSDYPSQILTILSLFALLGEKINAVNFDWGSLAPNQQMPKINISDIYKIISEYIDGYIHAIVSCEVKWGPFIYDQVPQNANICEGLLALTHAQKYSINKELFLNVFQYLSSGASDRGIKSKSLAYETIVPTAMYLDLCARIKSSPRAIIAKHLWDIHTQKGWGLYSIQSEGYENIGCTFWAIKALRHYPEIYNTDEFKHFIRSLYIHEKTINFGNTIESVNLNIPKLYATSMMFVIFCESSEIERSAISKRFDFKSALNYILDNFDNPYTMTESEAINGVNNIKSITVAKVPWEHQSLRYAIDALSCAIKLNMFSQEILTQIISRIHILLRDNSQKDGINLYWNSLVSSSKIGIRGRPIFPTMHMVAALSNLLDTINGG